MKKNNICLYF